MILPTKVHLILQVWQYLPLSAAYVHLWISSALVQIMACCLFRAKHLNQHWVIVNWTLGKKLQWNFNQNTKLFIHENAYENIVCEMAPIMSRVRWVQVRSHMRGRRRVENWLQHKSLHAFTHAQSRSGGGAGAKTAPQEMGPTPIFRIRFETARSKSSLSSRNGRSARARSTYVWTYLR